MPDEYALPEVLSVPDSITLPEAPGDMRGPELGELQALAAMSSGMSQEMLTDMALAGEAPDLEHEAALAEEANEAFDEVLAAVDLDMMTEDDIAMLEHGDEEQVRSVLKLQADNPDYEAGAPGRVSIKAMSPADRVRTVKALDMIRSGVAPGEAFAEVFGGEGESDDAGDEGYADDGGYAAVDGAPPDPFADDGEGEYDEAGYEGGTYNGGESYPQQQQAQAAAPRTTAPLPQVLELEARLGDLKRRYDSARSVYDPSASDLLEQMQDVKLNLRDAQRENTSYLQEQGQSHGRAMHEFADLVNAPQSSFVEFCEAEIVLAERRNDPIFRAPDWPEKIGRRVRDKYFPGGAAKSAPAAARYASYQMVPPAPHQRVRIPGSPVGIGFSAGTLSSETAVAEFDKLSPEGQDAALAEIERLSRRRR